MGFLSEMRVQVGDKPLHRKNENTGCSYSHGSVYYAPGTQCGKQQAETGGSEHHTCGETEKGIVIDCGDFPEY